MLESGVIELEFTILGLNLEELEQFAVELEAALVTNHKTVVLTKLPGVVTSGHDDPTIYGKTLHAKKYKIKIVEKK